MPIEFQCANCRKTLRVGDEHAGKSARCPSCQTVNAIPFESGETPTPETSSAPVSSNPFQDTVARNPYSEPVKHDDRRSEFDPNPYASPSSDADKGTAFPKGEIVPVEVEFDEIFSLAWDRWKNNLGLLVGMTLCVFGISLGLVGGLTIVIHILDSVGLDNDLVQLLGTMVQTFNTVMYFFLTIGQLRICLNIARGQPAEITHLFSGADRFLPFLGAMTLFGLALFAGFLLLIIPCFIVYILFWPVIFLVVENQTGVMDSFKVARSITRGNLGTVLVMMAASFGLGIVGILACYIGSFFTTPLISMIWAVAYLKMSGQNRSLSKTPVF